MSQLLESKSVLEGLRQLYRPESKSRQVSLAVYSKKLGYKSSRFIEMILKGDRVPSVDFIARTADLFSLSDMERHFLELQAQKERLQASGRPVDAWDRRIKELKKKVVSRSFIEPHFFTLFSDWYCLVIKQLLQASPAGLTVPEILARLRGKVSAAEAEKALHALLHLGFVERGDTSGSFVSVKQSMIGTRPDIPSEAVRKHHRQMMERAIEAMEEQGIAEREMISLSFTCSPKNLPKLKEALRRFRDEIGNEFSDSSPSVYQLNLQLFSHTK